MGVLAYVRAARPKQWSKNLLVFAALLFTANFSNPAVVRSTLVAFAAMCLLSSGTYVINDILDRERDREHPRRRLRPIASGQVPVGAAWAMGVILLASGLALGATINRAALGLLLAYLVFQAAYNSGMKRVPVLDVFAIAFGFILRAVLGAAAVGVAISSWLLMCTGALALMLGFGKRRHEFILQGEERGRSRESLDGYSLKVLDELVVMASVGAAMTYAIYVIESPTGHRFPGLVLTSLFVFYAVSRYVYAVFRHDEGGEPETLLFRDPHILWSIVGFVIAAVLAIKGLHIPMLEAPR
ncbi:MAG: decaprenyl-phosphate phosphoribosyltransferase [Fimbriimonas ginsengisoli]|uniref:Decaprenyl-phosphate phosphoribosyltransferase n=1 Tax=Fimbriimonas ginsengisoli TaxID=1005039 RepID=A0A931LZN4_FIMGI|nr:decaprenyl-phosphate phosphoribosyltransferase [Fimbriimonas ginsengisoli]